MDIIEPSNFFDLANVIGTVLMGLIAIAGLLIALNTYRVAVTALGVWRSEKEFDINMEGYAKSMYAIKVLEDLRSEQYNPDHVKSIWRDVLGDMSIIGGDDVYNAFIRIYSYSNYYKSLRDEIFEVRKNAMAVLKVSTDKHLKNFYDAYLTVEANLFAIHHNYHFSIINDFIEKHHYTKYNKERHVDCYYFDQLKLSQPSKSDNEIYKDLYDSFFQKKDGDPLDSLRSMHTSFYYQ